MGASNFSGQFNKGSDYFDGDGKQSRSDGSTKMPDMYTLMKELAAGVMPQFLKPAADGAANTATAETPFWVIPGYVKSVRSVKYIPAGALTADDTDYATLIVRAYKADGTLIGIVAQLATLAATGNWVAKTPVTIPLHDGTNPLTVDSTKLDLTAGGFLTLQITKANAGKAVPAGVLAVSVL